MWISKKEWEEMKRRVAHLERELDYQTAITVYKMPETPQFSYPYPLPAQRVMLTDLVMRILGHLGMGLKYVEGTPQKVDMVEVRSTPNRNAG